MGKVIIYSNHRIEGLKGQYIAPYFFKEEQLNDVEMIYTFNKEIEKKAKEAKVKVKLLTAKDK